MTAYVLFVGLITIQLFLFHRLTEPHEHNQSHYLLREKNSDKIFNALLLYQRAIKGGVNYRNSVRSRKWNEYKFDAPSVGITNIMDLYSYRKQIAENLLFSIEKRKRGRPSKFSVGTPQNGSSTACC
ncbi:hypothetical protein B4U80_10154 [Leptotrombidium deliense]|uniref:Uncharacterized protein n=1 Tax=Leptotrombidium deliense TaxID=299467 RepID=A0A443RXK8_9ACAR|nr:hypothetical protein B4U80_10154 [Leptotrombidium deliense]